VRVAFWYVVFLTFFLQMSCKNSATWQSDDGTEKRPSQASPDQKKIPLPGFDKRQQATTEELRGVWLTNIDSNVLFSQAALDSAFAKLDELNFTTVYPVVFNGGFTLYPSKVMQNVMGFSQDPSQAFQGRDIVQELKKAGEKHSLQVVPWFEYGFKIRDGGPFAKAKPQWIALSSLGNRYSSKAPAGSQVVWLNPLLEEVQRFYISLMIEFLDQYDLKTLQWDDNFSIPNDLLYDAATVARYKAETGLKAPVTINDPLWGRWVDWRSAEISKAVRKIFGGVKEARPGTRIVLSPNPFPWSKENYLQDWKTWLAQGSLDSLVVQVYRKNISDFEKTLLLPALTQEKYRTSIGILSGLRTEKTNIALVSEQVEIARKQGFRGVSFFFYESLFSFFESGESLEMRHQTVRNFFPVLSKVPLGL
jgi:uncharacterized lipoprotein YddW (UPF0748 family)